MFNLIEALNNKTPAETTSQSSAQHVRGLKLACVLADVIKHWLQDTAVSVEVQSVVKALGDPFTIIGQHHCAVEALDTMLRLLEAGINEHFAQVSLLEKRAESPQAKASKPAQNTVQPHWKFACCSATGILQAPLGSRSGSLGLLLGSIRM